MRRTVIAAITALVLTSLAATASGRTQETLQLRAVFAVKWGSAECPPGTPISTRCYLNEGRGTVPGLGKTNERYTLLVVNADTNCAGWQFTARFTVDGKGALDLAAKSTGCFSPTQTEGSLPFVVTGGSGQYEGASGGGTLKSGSAVETGPGSGTAVDTWVGTLDVPGLTFDTTAPVLTAVGNKTVKARETVKRLRVRYATPTANDVVDGTVPVVCRPRSGSFFKVGRTAVTCTATDESGNAASRKFVVTVKRA